LTELKRTNTNMGGGGNQWRCQRYKWKYSVNKVKKYKTDEPLMKLISEIINNTVLGNKENKLLLKNYV